MHRLTAVSNLADLQIATRMGMDYKNSIGGDTQADWWSQNKDSQRVPINI